MEALVRQWNGEHIVVHFDHLTGTWMFIAIHSTRLGRAAGGTRLKQYSSPRGALLDAMRLAEGMTYKFALTPIRRGGGKAVLGVSRKFTSKSRTDLMVRYGQLLSRLNGMLETAGDLGIGIDDLIIVKKHYDRVFGLPTDVGGAGDLGIPTALGVFVGIEESCKHAFGAKTLDNITVLVQGVGSVGGRLVELLLEAGCRVKFSDINEGQIQHFRDVVGLPFVSAESVYDEEADVFAPCAIGGILNYETVLRLRTRVVAGAANNQLLDSTIGDLLQRREMVYAPDFVVNAGAIIYAYSIEDENLSPEEANARVRAIGETLKSVFEIAYQQDISTARSAYMLANERIERFS